MALVNWKQTFRTPAGLLLTNAAVSVFLAGTSTSARVFDSNSILHDTTPQLYTDSVGFVELSLDQSDYSTGQLIDVFCEPDGNCDDENRVVLKSLMIFQDTEGSRNFKNIFTQTTMPTTGMKTDDLWFDTDNDNHPYTYDGTNWVSTRDGTIATAANTANWSEVVDDDDHKPVDDADVTPGLPSDTDQVCFLSCNEGTGTTALDESVESNDGTLINNNWGDGISGKCIEFNGSSDGVDIADANTINTMDVTQRTWSFWVKVDATANKQVLYKEGGSANGLAIYIESNILYFTYWSSDALIGYCQIPYTYTTWQHITCVFNSTGSFQGIRRNGLVGTDAGWFDDKSTTVYNHNGNITIGYNDAHGFRDSADSHITTSCWYAGLIDQFRIYNKILTLQEARALYLNPGGLISPTPGATNGATWGVDVADQPDDTLLLNEINCVGGYQEVSLPKEDGGPCCIDCYINNHSGTAYWFKVAEFDLTGNHYGCTWNGLFNYGSSNGRYSSQMRVRMQVNTNGAGGINTLTYKYSGDNQTANLKIAYVGVVITVYAYLGTYSSCLFDGAWSANLDAGNSWIHTEQVYTDNIGTSTPAGTFLTPGKNYTLGADITSANTANNASNYTGNSITTSYTSAKCTDANADQTSANTSNNTTYVNGSQTQASNIYSVYGDLHMKNGMDISFYSSTSQYSGGIYGTVTSIQVTGQTSLKLNAGSSIVVQQHMHPENSHSINLGTTSLRYNNICLDDIDRPYSTSGRLDIYNASTGAHIATYRYKFT